MFLTAVAADEEQGCDNGCQNGERKHTDYPVGVNELNPGEALYVGHRDEVHRASERREHTAVIRAVDDGEENKGCAFACFQVALADRFQHGHCYGTHHRRHNRVRKDGGEQRCDDEPDEDLLLDRGADEGERACRYTLVDARGFPCHAYQI